MANTLPIIGVCDAVTNDHFSAKINTMNSPHQTAAKMPLANNAFYEANSVPTEPVASIRVQPLDTASALIGKIGSLEVRLARNTAEIRQAQMLRYQVFLQDFSTREEANTASIGRDKDDYDQYCDHLLVIDTERMPGSDIVATYRIMQQQFARGNIGFYSQNEFDLAPMINRHPHLNFMEVGRSCVLPDYRSKRTLELMWHGLWSYCLQNNFDVMMGCASLPGTNLRDLALPLSFLHHFAPASQEWQVSAQSGMAADVELMAKHSLDPKQALRQLPPLIKGYLRLGAQFGGHAVIDPKFRTTDVFVIMPVAKLNTRYITHFGADASRMAGETTPRR